MSTYFWKNEKVLLKNFVLEDVNIVLRAMKDSAFRQQAEHGVSLPVSEKDVEDFMMRANEETLEGEVVCLSVRNLKDELVGYCWLNDIEYRAGNLELSVTIFPWEQRKGYGRAACEILLVYAFEELRMHKVNACVIGGNEAGLSFARAMGFLVEAERSEMFYIRGQYVSEIYLGMLKGEYLGVKTEQSVLDERLARRREDELCKPIGKADTFYAQEYYWKYLDISLGEMEPEYYLQNHEIVLDSMSSRFYNAQVKLPIFLGEMTEREEAHLHFGGADGRLEFAVMDQEGNYIGNVNLFGIDEKNGKFWLSIYMIPQARSKGYGRKVLERILSYAFLELRLNKFLVVVNDGNIASETMMKRVGCKVEGIHRACKYYMGQYVDEIFLGVTKEEFMAAYRD